MLALNNLVQAMLVAYATLSAVSAEKITKLDCGNVDTAAKRNCMQGTFDLWKRRDNSTTPAKTCRRHWCWNTSAFYLCNDNDHEVIIPYTRIADYAATIDHDCCQHTPKAISGQQFSDEGWSVVVSYGNCNHDQDASTPGPAPHPFNGVCE